VLSCVPHCAPLCGVVRVDERAEYLSIAEAATLLGVHRNTVRNRVKAGRYKAHKVVTPQGETYAILRGSLGLPLPSPTNETAQPLVTPVRDNADNPSQTSGVIDPQQQAQADAIVQRLLAPFIAELGGVREELGRVKAERDAQGATIAELRRRAALAEAELLRHRDEWALSRQRDAERAQTAQDAPGAPEGPILDNPSGEGSAGFWRRMRRWWGGSESL